MRAAAPLLLLLALAPPAAAAPPDEKPFPVPDRSRILREEKTVYVVEGRVRIPRGVEISVQKDVYIRSREGPAFIEVEGNFEVHGVEGKEVIFEGVTVVPCASFQKIQFEHCIFRKGGGVVTAKEAPAAGDFQVQSCKFQDTARVELAMTAGSVQLLDSSHGPALRITGVDAQGTRNRLKAVLRAFSPNGIVAENVADLTIRLCSIPGGTVTLRDVEVLALDGCKVESKEITFLQSKAGGFAKTKVTKCDLYSKKIVFRAPPDPKVVDAVVLDKCWFEGEVSADAIAARVVDGTDEKENNVRVRWTNPQERPLELAGKVER